MESSAHKLLAVFAADAVGYSRLMAQDDAATVTTLTNAGAFSVSRSNPPMVEW